MSLRATILATGSHVPARVLTNADLEKMVDTSDEWITSRTGIKTRHIAGPGEYTSILAAHAAQKALAAAGLGAADIDVLVVATISAEMTMPSCACLVQKEIGAVNAFAFDVNAACSGFLYALSVAEKQILADPSLKILVIGAETLSSRVDWQDRNTCVLFGDAAGAVILGSSHRGDGLLAEKLFSDGSLYNLLYIDAAQSLNADLRNEDFQGSSIKMAGRDVFKYAVKAMESAVQVVLDKAGVAVSEVSLVVPHQANIRIINKLGQKLGLDPEKIYINVSRYGNTSAATIPLALDEANRAGRLQSGDLVMLCAFGGGFTWGATLIKWQ
ncbi:MAG: 3-oxoacyl-ACP synthase [Desulfobulbaceae bacterium]|nr:MAG: 3-oxoacyl-ACP synthase [Desulfobulbaceae bacterium]